MDELSDPETHSLARFTLAKGLGDQIVEIRRGFFEMVGQQSYGDNKHISGFQGWRTLGITGRAQRIFGAVTNTLSDITMNICHYTLLQTHRRYSAKSES